MTLYIFKITLETRKPINSPKPSYSPYNGMDSRPILPKNISCCKNGSWTQFCEILYFFVRVLFVVVHNVLSFNQRPKYNIA